MYENECIQTKRIIFIKSGEDERKWIRRSVKIQIEYQKQINNNHKRNITHVWFKALIRFSSLVLNGCASRIQFSPSLCPYIALCLWTVSVEVSELISAQRWICFKQSEFSLELIELRMRRRWNKRTQRPSTVWPQWWMCTLSLSMCRFLFSSCVHTCTHPHGN